MKTFRLALILILILFQNFSQILNKINLTKYINYLVNCSDEDI